MMRSPKVDEFYLRLEFNNFMKENNMFSNEFINYLKDKTKILDMYGWFGCFPICDKDNKLISIRLLIPELNSIDDLLIWIHEYTHAYELYQNLGKTFVEDKQHSEELAVNMENKYKQLRLIKSKKI